MHPLNRYNDVGMRISSNGKLEAQARYRLTPRIAPTRSHQEQGCARNLVSDGSTKASMMRPSEARVVGKVPLLLNRVYRIESTQYLVSLPTRVEDSIDWESMTPNVRVDRSTWS